MAYLVVAGTDHGIRPFVVALNDGDAMNPGITSKYILAFCLSTKQANISRILPTRAGSKPLHHAMTLFDHVRLPASALLGKLEKPEDMRLNFQSVIERVGIGSLILTLSNVSSLRIAAYVAAEYSYRRTITSPQGGAKPIIEFSTQRRPIMYAFAQVAVWDSFGSWATEKFLTPNIEPCVRYGLAAAFKACLVQGTQSSMYTLSERCGSQGLFPHNQIISCPLETRGTSIAEGDVLALCIRCASELLIERYTLPPPPENPDCLLAKHEAGLFKEAREIMEGISDHRSEAFNATVLPLCQPLIETSDIRGAKAPHSGLFFE